MWILAVIVGLAIVLIRQGIFTYGSSAKDAKYRKQYKEYNNLYWKNRK